ncbi:MAG: methyltransferase domain-containing protein, partial [Planctomycetota bacterium]
TGAIAPSSKGLSQCITSKIPESVTPENPLRILEVGAGTGAFTERILIKLGQKDELHIYECNPKFTALLREKYLSSQNGSSSKDERRIFLFEDYIQTLEKEDYFHFIICGLPFNNFQPEVTEQIFGILYRALKNGGVLSFFEYFAIRKIKGIFCCEKENRRLKRIHHTLKRIRVPFEVEKKIIWRNIPPAVVWHLKK